METSAKANAVQETVERYIYQVARRLPNKGRGDIEAELRGLIEDMLETRCGETPPSKEDIDAVLTELGSPASFAARYGRADGKPQYLIGPEIFGQYIIVLKIVLMAVSIGLVVSTVIQSFAEAGSMNGFEIFGTWVGNITSGLFSAAAVVTLLFAIFERRGVKIGALDADWLNNLPPVPEKASRISRSDCIFGVVASLIFLILLIAAPRYIAVFANGRMIPLFDMALYQKLLPLIVACCVLGALKDVAKLLEGRYTMRLAIGLTVANAISIALCILVLTQPIWNRSLIILLDEAAEIRDPALLERIWDAIGQVFLAVVLLGTLVDTISVWVRTMKAERGK